MSYVIKNKSSDLYYSLTEGWVEKKECTRFSTKREAVRKKKNVPWSLVSEGRLGIFKINDSYVAPSIGTVFYHGGLSDEPCTVVNTTNDTVTRLDARGVIAEWGSLEDWFEEIDKGSITVVHDPESDENKSKMGKLKRPQSGTLFDEGVHDDHEPMMVIERDDIDDEIFVVDQTGHEFSWGPTDDWYSALDAGEITVLWSPEK